MYIKNPESEYAVRNWSLCGFQRVSLESKEVKKILLTVPFACLQVVNERGERIMDGNKIILYAGCSQPDERSAELLSRRPVQADISL